MARIMFEITRSNELVADGVPMGRFANEAAAADMAVRFAQDNDALYRIDYERRSCRTL